MLFSGLMYLESKGSLILADEDFAFPAQNGADCRGKGWFPLTTKAVVDVDNYELLADYAFIFSGQLCPVFLLVCFVFPVYSICPASRLPEAV